MVNKADVMFKLTLAFSAIASGGAISYYFAVFLPQQANLKVERELAVDTAKQRFELKRAKDASSNAKAARDKYEQCLRFAFTDYESRWQSSCMRQNKIDLFKRGKCLRDGFEKSFCSTLTLTPVTDCSLSVQLAYDYDNAHQNAKNLCLEEFKMAP